MAFVTRNLLKSRVARAVATWFFGPLAAVFPILTLLDSDCDISSLAILHGCNYLPAALVQQISLPAFFLGMAGLILTLPALLVILIYEAAARIKT